MSRGDVELVKEDWTEKPVRETDTAELARVVEVADSTHIQGTKRDGRPRHGYTPERIKQLYERYNAQFIRLDQEGVDVTLVILDKRETRMQAWRLFDVLFDDARSLRHIAEIAAEVIQKFRPLYWFTGGEHAETLSGQCLAEIAVVLGVKGESAEGEKFLMWRLE